MKSTQVDFAILVDATSSRLVTDLQRRRSMWRVHLSTSAKDFLVKLWPGILVFYVLMFFLAVETTIFGLPLTLLFDQNTTYLIVLRSGNFMLIVMLLSVLSAFAHDLQAAEKARL